jgi:serpin B
MAQTLHVAFEQFNASHPESPNWLLLHVNAPFATLLKTLNNSSKVDVLDDSGKLVQQPAYELFVANALWGQKGYAFKPEFTAMLQNSYGAGLNDVDFAHQTEQARKTINDWVAQQTKDKIKDLIPQGILDNLTRLVLTNAIYFKSNWAETFTKQATKDAPFKLSADQSVDVPMMHTQKSFPYIETDDFQMVELPYVAHELSMVILLPKKVDAVGDIEKNLTAANIDRWLNDKKPVPVEVTLPKFKFSSQFRLDDTLKGLGMKDAFDAGKADFSKMTAQERLYISAVIHKAFVAVDEEGTEAAAATAVVGEGGGAPMQPKNPKVFKADHPFIFLIRHNATGAILFMGRLVNPKVE